MTRDQLTRHRESLCGHCLLDGQPAEVRAPLQSEATVQTLDPAGPGIRVAWSVVEAVRRRWADDRGNSPFYTPEFANRQRAKEAA